MTDNLKRVSHVKPSTGPQAPTQSLAGRPGGGKVAVSKVSVPGLNKGVKVTRGT
jgi:hypothetical protein